MTMQRSSFDSPVGVPVPAAARTCDGLLPTLSSHTHCCKVATLGCRTAGEDLRLRFAFKNPTLRDHLIEDRQIVGIAMIRRASLAVVVKPVDWHAPRRTGTLTGQA